jgi:hypothetical protein
VTASTPYTISLTGSVPDFIKLVESEITIDSESNSCTADTYSIEIVLTSDTGLQNTYTTEIIINQKEESTFTFKAPANFETF